jgi:hypothetical protein
LVEFKSTADDKGKNEWMMNENFCISFHSSFFPISLSLSLSLFVFLTHSQFNLLFLVLFGVIMFRVTHLTHGSSNIFYNLCLSLIVREQNAHRNRLRNYWRKPDEWSRCWVQTKKQ